MLWKIYSCLKKIDHALIERFINITAGIYRSTHYKRHTLSVPHSTDPSLLEHALWTRKKDSLIFTVTISILPHIKCMKTHNIAMHTMTTHLISKAIFYWSTITQACSLRKRKVKLHTHIINISIISINCCTLFTTHS